MNTFRVDEVDFLSIIGKCTEIGRHAEKLQTSNNPTNTKSIVSFCWAIRMLQVPAERDDIHTIEFNYLNARSIDHTCFEIMYHARMLEATGDEDDLQEIWKCCSKIVDIVIKAAKEDYIRGYQDEQEEEPEKQT